MKMKRFKGFRGSGVQTGSTRFRKVREVQRICLNP